MRELPAGTVTFVFTDIEGSTRLLHELGDGYAEVLAEHRRVLREAFGRHGGVEVDTQGDAFFYAFSTAAAAVAAAAEAQRVLEDGPVRVRMGIHTGEPIVTQEGYVGVDIHKGARVAAAGHGGQVLVSASTRDLVQGQVPLRDLGEHRLKDLAAPERLYQLGDDDFPPLASLNNTNLPLRAEPVLGRKRELGDLLRLVRRGEARLVTLTGAGGIGKTTLALQTASELSGDFPHGVWLVDLSAVRDEQLVESSVAAVLGAKVGLVEHVRDRRLLLVLDNFEQVIGAAPLVGALLASCARVVLLVTSREPLRVAGEREYRLQPLAEAPAVELFRSRAESASPAFTAGYAQVAEVCRHLDSLPLAIELAAARVATLPVDELRARLDQRLPLLGRGRRDAPARQRTLRATIEWSHDLLEPDEQELFRRLAVFAGGWTLAAAEAVCGAEIATLESLVGKSLVRFDGRRNSMLETIREYALELLDRGADADELRRRHAQWHLALAEAAEPDLRGPAQLDRLRELDDEHENFRHALAWALRGGDATLGVRLAARLSWFWQLHSYLKEGRGWLDEAAAAADAAPLPVRAAVFDGLGRLAFYDDDANDGVAHLTEAVRLWREAGERVELARSLVYLGVSAAAANDPDLALRTREEAVAVARESGESWTIGLALWALGSGFVLGHVGQRDHEAAEPVLEESVERMRAAGDRWGLGGALFYLGLIAHDRGEHAQAARTFDEAASLFREIGDKWRLVRAVDRLAAVAERMGDAVAAERLLAERDALREELDYVPA